MKEKDVRIVESTIDSDPLDFFWDAEKAKAEENSPNSVLFEDVLEMLNRNGMDLILVKKEDTLCNIVTELHDRFCPNDKEFTEEFLEELDERGIGYMDEGSFGEYSSEENVETFAGEQNVIHAREWFKEWGMYFWWSLKVSKI